MSITVQCQCGKRFAAQPHLAGKQLACPSCGNTITVPGKPATLKTRRATAVPPAKVPEPKAKPAPPVPVSASTQKQTQAGTIRVECQCGSAFAAQSHLRGKQVACPKCGKTISVAAAVGNTTPKAAPKPATSSPTARAAEMPVAKAPPSQPSAAPANAAASTKPAQPTPGNSAPVRGKRPSSPPSQGIVTANVVPPTAQASAAPVQAAAPATVAAASVVTARTSELTAGQPKKIEFPGPPEALVSDPDLASSLSDDFDFTQLIAAGAGLVTLGLLIGSLVLLWMSFANLVFDNQAVASQPDLRGGGRSNSSSLGGTQPSRASTLKKRRVVRQPTTTNSTNSSSTRPSSSSSPSSNSPSSSSRPSSSQNRLEQRIRSTPPRVATIPGRRKYTVTFQVLDYRGNRNIEDAAREALQGNHWADLSDIRYQEAPTRSISVGVRVMSVSTANAKSRLEALGFDIGTTSITSKAQ